MKCVSKMVKALSLLLSLILIPVQAMAVNTVWGWGANSYGQLGIGSYDYQFTPVQVSDLTNVIAIASGGAHSLALKADGTVWAWGYNIAGQIGNGSTADQTTPVQVVGLTNVTAIAAGAYHSLALKADGTVWAWGSNWWGQLGNDFVAYPYNQTTPIQVEGLTGVSAITAGGFHSMALKSDGTVCTWGANYFGQLGIGYTSYYSYRQNTPLQVVGLTNATAIAAGAYHSLAIKSDGTLWAWGYNSIGQLGDGSFSYNQPRPVQVMGDTGIIATAAGGWHSKGLKNDGTVWAWGHNGYGELGIGYTSCYECGQSMPVQVTGLTGVVTIATGSEHTLAIKDDGTLWAWGWNEAGQIGNGSVSYSQSTPVQVVGLTGVTAVAAGWWHSLALSTNQPPTANAGTDQIIECAEPSGTPATLDGLASSDPDGEPLTYTWTWAGGSAEGVNPTVTLPLGTTVVTLTVSDGKATVTDTVDITIRDTTPPITTATGGNEDWYNTNVILTFMASDSCSGVKEIHYNVSGSETVVPGGYTSLPLTADGIYNIAYFAVDNAGNSESPKNMTVKMDKTPPVLNLSANPNILWPPNHEMVDVLIGGNAYDATSGIVSVVLTVKDEYGTIQPSISGFNTTVPLEAWREGTDKDGRHYTITAVATDTAGNKSTASTEVLVPHDQR